MYGRFANMFPTLSLKWPKCLYMFHTWSIWIWITACIDYDYYWLISQKQTQTWLLKDYCDHYCYYYDIPVSLPICHYDILYPLVKVYITIRKSPFLLWKLTKLLLIPWPVSSSQTRVRCSLQICSQHKAADLHGAADWTISTIFSGNINIFEVP